METGPLSWNIYVSASHDGWQLEKSVANGGRDIGTNASAARPPCMQQHKQSGVRRIQWRRMEMLEMMMMMMMAEERGKTTVTVEWKYNQRILPRFIGFSAVVARWKCQISWVKNVILKICCRPWKNNQTDTVKIQIQRWRRTAETIEPKRFYLIDRMSIFVYIELLQRFIPHSLRRVMWRPSWKPNNRSANLFHFSKTKNSSNKIQRNCVFVC